MTNFKIILSRIALANYLIIAGVLGAFHDSYWPLLLTYLIAGCTTFFIFACPRPFWRWSLVKTGVATVFVAAGPIGLLAFSVLRTESEGYAYK